MTEGSPPSTVECPDCGTRFQVHQADLAAREGRLRCGACLKVFRVVDAMEAINKRDRPRPSFPAWVVVGLVLAVAALAVQITWLQTDYRARNLQVSRHADAPGVLAVQFVVVHDARIPAPFPSFDVEFATTGGEPVGSRRFRPGEYLGSEPPDAERLARLRLLAPEAPHQVRVNVPHPGAAAAQVTISFPARFTIGW